MITKEPPVPQGHPDYNTPKERDKRIRLYRAKRAAIRNAEKQRQQPSPMQIKQHLEQVANSSTKTLRVRARALAGLAKLYHETGWQNHIMYQNKLRQLAQKMGLKRMPIEGKLGRYFRRIGL